MAVDMESKFRELLQELNPEDQSLLAKTLMRVMAGEKPDPHELPEPVQVACAVFGAMQLGLYADQQEVKEKRKRDQPILELAERLLTQMIQANPNARVADLAEDAMQAAQKLHSMG